jgi:purine-binding chemotaxis protein CheW
VPPKKVLLARLGQQLFAIPIEAIEEVLPELPVEPLADSPAFVRGIVFVRGHLIPVLSGAARLGVPVLAVDEPKIVCLRTSNRLIGVEFDDVIDLLDLRTELLPAQELGAGNGCVTGVFEHEGRIVRLVDAERLAATSVPIP